MASGSDRVRGAESESESARGLHEICHARAVRGARVEISRFPSVPRGVWRIRPGLDGARLGREGARGPDHDVGSEGVSPQRGREIARHSAS